MKKRNYISILMAFTLAFCLVGCQAEEVDTILEILAPTSQNEEISDISTISEITTQPPISSQDITTTSDIFAQLFADQESDVQVLGSGIVSKILSDDTKGSKHQRFIIELESGQTLLIAHNIDIAPRVEPLEIGDAIEFYGEYYYSDQGGGVHWTHHDPNNTHIDGYLKCGDVIFD